MGSHGVLSVLFPVTHFRFPGVLFSIPLPTFPHLQHQFYAISVKRQTYFHIRPLLSTLSLHKSLIPFPNSLLVLALVLLRKVYFDNPFLFSVIFCAMCPRPFFYVTWHQFRFSNEFISWGHQVSMIILKVFFITNKCQKILYNYTRNSTITRRRSFQYDIVVHIR